MVTLYMNSYFVHAGGEGPLTAPDSELSDPVFEPWLRSPHCVPGKTPLCMFRPCQGIIRDLSANSSNIAFEVVLASK